MSVWLNLITELQFNVIVGGDGFTIDILITSTAVLLFDNIISPSTYLPKFSPSGKETLISLRNLSVSPDDVRPPILVIIPLSSFCFIKPSTSYATK